MMYRIQSISFNRQALKFDQTRILVGLHTCILTITFINISIVQGLIQVHVFGEC